MSLLSNFLHGVVDAVTGRQTPGPIVDNPTTPIEAAVNAAGQVVTQAITATTPVMAQEANSTVQTFLAKSVGNVGAQVADVSLQMLAATALAGMSSSSNTSVAEIAELLTGVVKVLANPTPATLATPAA